MEFALTFGREQIIAYCEAVKDSQLHCSAFSATIHKLAFFTHYRPTYFRLGLRASVDAAVQLSKLRDFSCS